MYSMIHSSSFFFFSAHGARVLGCPSLLAGVCMLPLLLPLPPPLAQGAAVAAPGGGSLAVPVAHGARVGWFGPVGASGAVAFAHGAAVTGIPGLAATGSRRGGWAGLEPDDDDDDDDDDGAARMPVGSANASRSAG